MTELRLPLDIVTIARTSIRDVENWLSRLELRTQFLPTVRGRRREYSRSNAMELALISAFVRVGVRASEAAECAFPLIEQVTVANGLEGRYCVFADGNYKSILITDEFELQQWKLLYPGADTFAFVDVTEIRDRVDRAFADYQKDVNDERAGHGK